MLYALVSQYLLVWSFMCLCVHSFIQEILKALCIPVTAFNASTKQQRQEPSPDGLIILVGQSWQ